MLTEIKTEFIHYMKSRKLLNKKYKKIYHLRNNFLPILFIIIFAYMSWCVDSLREHYFTPAEITSLYTLFENVNAVLAYSKEQAVISNIGYMYLSLIFSYILTSVNVVLKVNCPLMHKIFWLIEKFIIAGIFVFGCVQILSYSCLEPTYISNYIHTQTFLGRGWDYEVGSGVLFLKGYIIVGSIGRKNMLEVIKKYSPESQIIGEEILTKITLDPEVLKKLLETCSSEELSYLGISKGIPFF